MLPPLASWLLGLTIVGTMADLHIRVQAKLALSLLSLTLCSLVISVKRHEYHFPRGVWSLFCLNPCVCFFFFSRLNLYAFRNLYRRVKGAKQNWMEGAGISAHFPPSHIRLPHCLPAQLEWEICRCQGTYSATVLLSRVSNPLNLHSCQYTLYTHVQQSISNMIVFYRIVSPCEDLSIVWSWPKYSVIGNINAVFSDWLFPLSYTHLRFLSILSWLNRWLLFGSE